MNLLCMCGELETYGMTTVERFIDRRVIDIQHHAILPIRGLQGLVQGLENLISKAAAMPKSTVLRPNGKAKQRYCLC